MRNCDPPSLCMTGNRLMRIDFVRKFQAPISHWEGMGHSNTSTSVENLHLSTSDDPEISDRVVVEVRNAKGGLLDLRGLNLGRDRSEKKYGYTYLYYIYMYMICGIHLECIRIFWTTMAPSNGSCPFRFLAWALTGSDASGCAKWGTSFSQRHIMT